MKTHLTPLLTAMITAELPGPNAGETDKPKPTPRSSRG